MKIATIATIPDELANEWLQRTFVISTAGIRVVISKISAVTNLSTEAMLRAMQIEPPLVDLVVLPKD